LSTSGDGQRSLPLRLSSGPVYSEHGFVVIQAAAGDDDSYWMLMGPGVRASHGWVHVSGGLVDVDVQLELVVREATAEDGDGPGPGAPTLEVTDRPLSIADPVSAFGLSWPVGAGIYQVSAEFADVPSADELLMTQKWRIEMIGWRVSR
jgi:hypothetical protein